MAFSLSEEIIRQFVDRLDNIDRRLAHLESIGSPTFTAGNWTNRPTAPHNGDWFWCTDRAIVYYWNSSISRWASVEPLQSALVPYNFNNGQTATGTLVQRVVLEDDYDIYLEKFQVYYIPSLAQSVSNYWTFQSAQMTSFNTQTATVAGVDYRPAITTLSGIVSTSSVRNIAIQATPTGSPGAIGWHAIIRYRLLG